MSSKETMIEGTLAVILSILFGNNSEALNTLLLFYVINIIAGTIKGIVKHNLSSHKFLTGVIKGLAIAMMIIIGNRIDLIYPEGINGVIKFRDMFIYFYIVYLMLSIIENYSQIGMPIPKKFQKVLDILKEEIK